MSALSVTRSEGPFAGLMGNDGPLSLLERAVEADRPSHAYLFEGPSGVGKYAAALAFAKAIMHTDEGWARWHAEGTDGIRMHALTQEQEVKRAKKKKAARAAVYEEEARAPIHPDLEIIRPTGPTRRIPIDFVREISLATASAPAAARRKVFIVDDADRVGRDAAPPFLKVLEEPPPFLVTILVSSRGSQVLPTIRSRCSVVRFSPMQEADLAAYLTASRGLSPMQARFLARYSSGRFGVAVSCLADEEFMGRRDRLLDRLEALTEPTTIDLLLFSRDYSESKELAETLLADIRMWLRDLVLVGQRGDSALEAVHNVDRVESLKRLAVHWPGPRAARAMALCAGLEQSWLASGRNLNLRLALEAFMLKAFAGIEGAPQ